MKGAKMNRPKIDKNKKLNFFIHPASTVNSYN